LFQRISTVLHRFNDCFAFSYLSRWPFQFVHYFTFKPSGPMYLMTKLFIIRPVTVTVCRAFVRVVAVLSWPTLFSIIKIVIGLIKVKLKTIIIAASIIHSTATALLQVSSDLYSTVVYTPLGLFDPNAALDLAAHEVDFVGCGAHLELTAPSLHG
jgi:hypothetical protein